MYGTDGSFQPPVALPFDNSLLGQKFQFYLENLLMPGGASLPAQLVIDAVGAGEINTIASAFDDAISEGCEQQLVARVAKGKLAVVVLQRSMCRCSSTFCIQLVLNTVRRGELSTK